MDQRPDPASLTDPSDADRVPLAAILAGGKAQRMGTDKVGLPLEGVPLVERVWQRVAPVASRVVVVGGAPRLDHRGVPTLPDRYPGANAMGGIATALYHAADTLDPGAWVLCVACDMPLLEPALLGHLIGLREGFDVVVPRVPEGHEPLCALYRATCLPLLEEQIAAGNLRIFDLFTRVRTRRVTVEEMRPFDPELHSFLNINRPADLELAGRILRGEG